MILTCDLNYLSIESGGKFIFNYIDTQLKILFLTCKLQNPSFILPWDSVTLIYNSKEIVDMIADNLFYGESVYYKLSQLITIELTRKKILLIQILV